ncbi:hypothetical protein CHS0354_024380, partial [Potamilus streckersoni]
MITMKDLPVLDRCTQGYLRDASVELPYYVCMDITTVFKGFKHTLILELDASEQYMHKASVVGNGQFIR